MAEDTLKRLLDEGWDIAGYDTESTSGTAFWRQNILLRRGADLWSLSLHYENGRETDRVFRQISPDPNSGPIEPPRKSKVW